MPPIRRTPSDTHSRKARASIPTSSKQDDKLFATESSSAKSLTLEATGPPTQHASPEEDITVSPMTDGSQPSDPGLEHMKKPLHEYFATTDINLGPATEFRPIAAFHDHATEATAILFDKTRSDFDMISTVFDSHADIADVGARNKLGDQARHALKAMPKDGQPIDGFQIRHRKGLRMTVFRGNTLIYDDRRHDTTWSAIIDYKYPDLTDHMTFGSSAIPDEKARSEFDKQFQGILNTSATFGDGGTPDIAQSRDIMERSIGNYLSTCLPQIPIPETKPSEEQVSNVQRVDQKISNWYVANDVPYNRSAAKHVFTIRQSTAECPYNMEDGEYEKLSEDFEAYWGEDMRRYGALDQLSIGHDLGLAVPLVEPDFPVARYSAWTQSEDGKTAIVVSQYSPTADQPEDAGRSSMVQIRSFVPYFHMRY